MAVGALEGAPVPPRQPAVPTQACGTAAAQLQQQARLQAALARRLPPAAIVPLDGGYLVVRRRGSAGGGASATTAEAPYAWSEAREHRYQAQLRSLCALARLRLALPLCPDAHPEQRFCAVAAGAAAAS